MSVEQFVTILGAITALVVAVGVCIQQVRSTRTAVDGRMSELLELTRHNATLEATADAAASASHDRRAGDSPERPARQ